jgi:integrase
MPLTGHHNQELFDVIGTLLVTSIEDGFDVLFVQQQVGHEHASTTSLYTSVSSDYRTRMLRTALDRTIDKAHGEGGGW